jgi:hypothetical protein
MEKHIASLNHEHKALCGQQIGLTEWRFASVQHAFVSQSQKKEFNLCPQCAEVVKTAFTVAGGQ